MEKKKQDLGRLCPDCKTEFEFDRVKDVDAGGVLITVSVVYCPKCAYLHTYDVSISL